MAKALEVDASPEVPMEWRHRRGTLKSESVIKSALEKVVKLRSNPTAYELRREPDALGYFHEIDIVDGTLNPCNWVIHES